MMSWRIVQSLVNRSGPARTFSKSSFPCSTSYSGSTTTYEFPSLLSLLRATLPLVGDIHHVSRKACLDSSGQSLRTSGGNISRHHKWGPHDFSSLIFPHQGFPGTDLLSCKLSPTKLSFSSRFYGSVTEEVKVAEGSSKTGHTLSNQEHPNIVLYNGRWMRLFRLVVRLKVIQLTGVAALAFPIAQITQQGSVLVGTVAAVGAVVGGAAAASCALWYYSRRYIGELALLAPAYDSVQISTIDFWGNRQELRTSLSNVVAPLKGLSRGEVEQAARHVFLPLDGQRALLMGLLHGTLTPSQVMDEAGRANQGSADIKKPSSAQ
eukprot:jgi/Mesen1/6978/ME000362S06107